MRSMEYVLFANGDTASKQAVQALRDVQIPFRLVRPREADGPLPALLSPAGMFRGVAEIKLFASRIASDK